MGGASADDWWPEVGGASAADDVIFGDVEHDLGEPKTDADDLSAVEIDCKSDV